MRRTATLAILSILAVLATVFVTARPGGQEAAAAELERYGGCDALTARIVAEARDQVGPYGLDGGGPVFMMEEPVAGMARDSAAADAPPAPASGQSAESSATTSATGTNIQVAGVDEPDQVKLADGLLAVVDGGRVALVDVTTVTPRTIGHLDPATQVDLQPASLLVVGSRLVVLGSTAGGPVPGPAQSAPVPGGDTVGIMPASPGRTAVAVYDITDPSAPTLTDHLTIDGRLLSARLTDGRVLLATSSTPTLPFVYPGDGSQAAQDRAAALNRQTVADSTAGDWLAEVTFADGTSRLLADCTQVGVPDQIDGWQAISLAAFDPAASLTGIRAAGTFGAGQTVYATADRVYVAGTHAVPDRISTHIHAFDVTGDPAYLGSGEVEGELLNQFAMDRYDGHLRVATTPMTIAGPGGARITVLDETGHALTTVGTLDGLGRGETIRAVRYLGPVGFVVTFRQTDPLFALDLSDPAHPAKAGELKIPGYSAYLHPIADGRLLGIGRSATETGQVTGLQVSLFDTSNLAAPDQRDVLDVAGGATAIEWDHHAFTWLSDAHVAAIPIDAGWIAEPLPAPMPEQAPPPSDAGSGTSSSAGTATATAATTTTAPSAATDRPSSPQPTQAAGLLLVRVDGDQLVQVARIDGPTTHGWAAGFSRTIVHDGTFLAVAPGAVWRIGADGTVLAKASLS